LRIIASIIFRLTNGYWLFKDSIFNIGYTKPITDRRQYSLREGYINRAQGITINTLGFRGAPVPINSELVYVVLGDSIPFGSGVRDEQTYPYILDKLISGVCPNIRVLNAAVPSYNLRQSFDRFYLDVLKYYKNIPLVIINTAKDISLFAYFGESYNADVTWAALRWSKAWKPKNILYKLAILNYLEKALHREKYKCLPSAKLIENIHKILETNLNLLKARSMTVILLPIDPFYYHVQYPIKRNNPLKLWICKDYINNWKSLIDDFNAELEALSREYDNVFFLDTRYIMDEQNRDEMYLDFCHYSAKGNQIVAETFFNFLKKKQLLSAANKFTEGINIK